MGLPDLPKVIATSNERMKISLSVPCPVEPSNRPMYGRRWSAASRICRNQFTCDPYAHAAWRFVHLLGAECAQVRPLVPTMPCERGSPCSRDRYIKWAVSRAHVCLVKPSCSLFFSVPHRHIPLESHLGQFAMTMTVASRWLFGGVVLSQLLSLAAAVDLRLYNTDYSCNGNRLICSNIPQQTCCVPRVEYYYSASCLNCDSGMTHYG